MDINLAIGIIGLGLTIGTTIYAIYIRRKSNLEKRFIYEVIPPVPVAEVIKNKAAYSLRVVYERSNHDLVYIDNAYLQLVRFANFGKVPITRNDLAKSDKLSIEISDGSILDISLLSTTRSACQISLGKQNNKKGKVSAELDFEFLDYLDGGIIQILSDSKNLQTIIKGTVIGMPRGIRENPNADEPHEVSGWGCGLGVFGVIIAFTAVLFIYRYIMGNWSNVWLLTLPIAALIIPLVLFSILQTIFSQGKNKFPEQLLPPQWYQLEKGWYFPPTRGKYQKKLQELLVEIDDLKSQLQKSNEK